MKEKKAIVLLFLASFLWGMAFIFQSLASGKIGPIYFTGIRMLLGFVVLIPFLIKVFKKHKGDKEYFKTAFLGGFVCGLTTAVPSILQQIGLIYTTAGKAGFITSLYILFVPLLSIVLGKKVSLKTWLCIAAATAGAFLLCGNASGKINKGDLYIFICALLFAIQIMCIDHFVAKLEGIDLSSLQFLFAGIISLIVAVFTETLEFADIKASIIPILYTGIISCAVAYSLQVIGQKYVAPAKATLPLSLENAWSAVGGAMFLHQYMNLRELSGCVVLFAAVLIAQLNFKKKDIKNG